MTDALDNGEQSDLDTRVDGGPTIRRDSRVDDAFQVGQHGGELSRDEIVALAEAAGLEVVADD